ncbi:MAG: RpiB/LacA/LacB family sugar-phosphate isomerase [Candidatus Dependentiae bacterium]|nr:RpiB/LacA/LacB family sugar-phosphate isomerase [Candidatus Dependentiae bacterium]
MKIVIGADHRGFSHKACIKERVQVADKSIEWLDVGAYNADRSDYPVFVEAVCQALLERRADFGILLCGSGVGMSIAANRFPGIYAALAWNEEVARMSRQDDNANILVLPADFVSHEQAIAMVKSWLQATFKQGRYQERLTMVDNLEVD